MDLFSTIFYAGTVLLVAILLLVEPLHVLNLHRVHKKIEMMRHCNVDKKSFYKEITISIGSNFCALALGAWIMLIVAIAYLYLLVPTVSPFSYMKQIPVLASNPLGFAIFGLAVGGITSLVILGLDKLPPEQRAFKLTEMYSFYTIPKSIKRLIGFTVPLLCISVIFSAYIGTVYPDPAPMAELLSFMLVLISAILLAAPIYQEAWRGRA